jgi:hypothetical protein
VDALLTCYVGNLFIALEREEDSTARKTEDKVDAQVKTNDLLSYTVTVKISDVEDAGTDVPLYIELIGDKGNSRQIYLEERTDNRDRNLQRSTENEFLVRALDIGQVGL